MHAILEELDASDRRLLRRRAMPAFTPLMLATLAKHAFSDPGVGVRSEARRSALAPVETALDRPLDHQEREGPHLALSRSGRGRPAVRHRTVDRGRRDRAFRGNVTSFARLQERMRNSRPSTTLIAAVPPPCDLFDLIWFDGYDLSALPLLARKSILHHAVSSRTRSVSPGTWTRRERSRSAPLARRAGRPHRQTGLGSPTGTGARTTG